MNRKLVISACGFLMPEIAHVVKNGDYPDVRLLGFQGNCSENSISPSQILNKISESDKKLSDNIIICNVCYARNKSDEESENIKIIKLEQCFELIINREIVNDYISKGYYIVTNGWLRNYEQNILNWGFNKENAKLFFGESMKKILLLDTKIPGDYIPHLKALSEYMGLPYEILPVGISHCKMFIDSIVFNWRNESDRRSLNEKLSTTTKQTADYSVIFNQLEILVNLTEEVKIIEVGFELLNILFAPTGVKYIRFINNKKEELIFNGLFFNHQSGNGEGLKIEVYHSNELLGFFDISGFKFPQFLNQYKKMGIIISQIFGLSIANARKYRITIEQREQLEIYSLELQKINASKDKFFSIIAHDLKGPFNSLIGFNDLLIEDIQSESNENIKEYSTIIHQTIHKTYNLLINLLEWARSQTDGIEFFPELFFISESVNEIISLLNPQANKKGITIIKKISDELKIFGDSNMLVTVIRNLISNAIKYSNNNGEITISAFIKNDLTQISVSDTGVGISPEKLGKLFLVEHTSSTLGTSEEKGTGLGLILCKEFIEKHSGKIWAESVEGKGSIFHFTIPKQIK
jgi:signal transduction histidine kinase